jgi:glutaredoxin-dependent peroxiredoxin
MAIQVGQQAPDIELPLAGSKDKFKLSDYKGKQPVVLLFFPLAWTGVCTQQMCEMRDALAKFNNLNAKVVGISVDSPFALDKFKADQNLNFDLASDFNKSASETYGALYEDLMGFKGVSKRSAFVVGKDGKVLHALVNESAKDIPSLTDIEAAVAKG